MEKEICIEESGNAMEKLKACNPEYCFLGITADGGKCHSVPAPWDSTVAVSYTHLSANVGRFGLPRS